MVTEINQNLYFPLNDFVNEQSKLVLENGLLKLQGIISHEIKPGHKYVLLQVDNTPDLIPNVVKTIRDLGYEVNTMKKTFPVLNMSCASCAIRIENILRAQKGVVNASVNFASATGSIEYITNITNAEELRKAVQSNGFDMLIEENKNSSDVVEDINRKKFRQLKIRTIGAVILSILIVIIGMFFMNIPYSNYIMWLLSTPVIVIFGKDFFVKAWKQAKHLTANMDTLVALS